MDGFVTECSETSTSSCPCLKDNGCCSLHAQNMPDEVKQQRFCFSEDYDFCPTYLSYILTHTQSLRNDSDWLDAHL